MAQGETLMIRNIPVLSFVVLALAVHANAQSSVPFIERQAPTDVRLLDFNVNWDSIFPDNDPQNHPFREYNKRAEFIRIVTAMAPDIVCLQEINDARNPQQIASLLDQIVPIGGGQVWKAHKGSDNVIASKYPLSLLRTDTVPTTNRGQAMALIDLPDDVYATDLYLMNAHFKASGGNSNIQRRQQHADAIVNWIRDIRAPGGLITLAAGTPVMVLGDLNAYDTDPAYHVTTLVTGDIVDESTYGADLPPDWDNTSMTDALPIHNGAGSATYTWRDDTGGFNPGALDRVIYSDSAMSIGNRFVLDTTTMTALQLSVAGLQADDVALDAGVGLFDHYPIVVDLRFEMAPSLDGDVTLDGLVDGADIELFVSMATGGPESANTTRIAHADFNGNGAIDLGDIADFVTTILAQ